MTPHARLLPLLALGPALALGLAGPRADARPLLRLHVRPSAYRLAAPRLPSVGLPSVVRQAAGLAPAAAAALVPQASGPAALARAVITASQAPARALLGRR